MLTINGHVARTWIVDSGYSTQSKHPGGSVHDALVCFRSRKLDLPPLKVALMGKLSSFWPLGMRARLRKRKELCHNEGSHATRYILSRHGNRMFDKQILFTRVIGRFSANKDTFLPTEYQLAWWATLTHTRTCGKHFY